MLLDMIVSPTYQFLSLCSQYKLYFLIMKGNKMKIETGSKTYLEKHRGTIVLGLALLALPALAFAAGEAAPWDGALCWLVGALKGKTAIAVATIAFVAAAVGFVWGEQLTGIFKTLVNIFVAVCIMLGASSIVTTIASKVDSSIGQQCS